MVRVLVKYPYLKPGTRNLDFDDIEIIEENSVRQIFFVAISLFVLGLTACDGGNVKKLETQVTELQNQVNTLTAERDELKTQVDDLTAQLAAIKSEHGELGAAGAALGNALENATETMMGEAGEAVEEALNSASPALQEIADAIDNAANSLNNATGTDSSAGGSIEETQESPNNSTNEEAETEAPANN